MGVSKLKTGTEEAGGNGSRDQSQTAIAGIRLLRGITVEQSTVLEMAIRVDLSQLQKFLGSRILWIWS